MDITALISQTKIFCVTCQEKITPVKPIYKKIGKGGIKNRHGISGRCPQCKKGVFTMLETDKNSKK